MKRGYDIIGLPVICLEETCKNMEIKDILYDRIELKATSLLVKENGFFREQKVIKLQNIKTISPDGVVIQNKTAIEESPCQNHIQSFQGLVGMDVVTHDGQSVGIVQDILFDINTGILSGLIFSEGLFHDLVEGRSILPLAEDIHLNTNTIMISASEEKSILSNTGGFKKIFSLE